VTSLMLGASPLVAIAAGACALLARSSLDDAGRARIRVASVATASPKLRVALDATVGAEEDAEVEEQLAALAADWS
jgi:hypothetical protein